jgi:hypothetical protein
MSCILIRYTRDKNLEMIQAFRSCSTFCVFGFGQAKNQTRLKIGL